MPTTNIMRRMLLALIAAAITLLTLTAGWTSCGTTGGGSGGTCINGGPHAGVVYDRHPPSNRLSDEYTLDIRRPDGTNTTAFTDEFGYDNCNVGAGYPRCACTTNGIQH